MKKTEESQISGAPVWIKMKPVSGIEVFPERGYFIKLPPGVPRIKQSGCYRAKLIDLHTIEDSTENSRLLWIFGVQMCAKNEEETKTHYLQFATGSEYRSNSTLQIWLRKFSGVDNIPSRYVQALCERLIGQIFDVSVNFGSCCQYRFEEGQWQQITRADYHVASAEITSIRTFNRETLEFEHFSRLAQWIKELDAEEASANKAREVNVLVVYPEEDD